MGAESRKKTDDRWLFAPVILLFAMTKKSHLCPVKIEVNVFG